jgi:hypothetical protein
MKRKRERDKSENGEIHSKNTLGNRRDDVPSGKEKTKKNCFSPREFLWSKPISRKFD